MSVGKDFKHLRRSTDKKSMPKNELWPLLGCVVLTIFGTVAFLVILADSI